MGCGSSKVYVVNDNKPGQGQDCLEALRLLHLSDEDINVLYEAFSEFDLAGDGTISLIEFLTVLQIGNTNSNICSALSHL
jgi:Ca2+-binding EF-hand superfamily protein